MEEVEEADVVAEILAGHPPPENNSAQVQDLAHYLQAIDPKLSQPSNPFADTLKTVAEDARFAHRQWHRQRGLPYP